MSSVEAAVFDDDTRSAIDAVPSFVCVIVADDVSLFIRARSEPDDVDLARTIGLTTANGLLLILFELSSLVDF